MIPSRLESSRAAFVKFLWLCSRVVVIVDAMEMVFGVGARVGSFNKARDCLQFHVEFQQQRPELLLLL